MHRLMRFPICLAVLSVLILAACSSSPTPQAEFDLAVVRLEPLQSDLFEDPDLDLTGTNVDPKSRKIISDKNAVDGKAAALYRSGEGVRFRLKNIKSGAYKVSVRARGKHYQGWPIMRAKLGKTRVGKDLLVEDAKYQTVELGELDLKTNQSFYVSFRNDHWGGRPDRDRNLYIDHLTLTPVKTAPNTPAPVGPPEPAPQPNPTTPQPAPQPTPQPSPQPSPQPQRGYYISPNGNDANDGLSPATAWRTLGKLRSATLKEGYPVLLERGNTFRETLHVARAGSKNTPFAISAYGEGANPIVSGADVVTAWKSEGSGRYSAALKTSPQRVWHADKELVRGEHNSLSEGQFAHHSGRLYVRLAKNRSPQSAHIEASVRESAVRDAVGYDHVHIENIVGEKTNGSSRHDAVFSAHPSSDHWTLKNSVARYGAANGFFGEQGSAKGVGSHLLIQSSEAAHNTKRGAVAAGYRSTNQVFNGLYSHHNHGDGLLINSKNGVLKNSRLNHNGNMVGGNPKHGFYMYPWNGGAANWQIFDNELVGNRESGGRIAGVDTQFFRNSVSESRYGIFVVDNDGSNSGHIIENNLFFDTHPWAHVVELEGAENVTVRNNTFVDAFGLGLINGKHRANRNITLSANLFGGNPDTAFVFLDPAQDSGLKQNQNCFDAGLNLGNARNRRQALMASGFNADSLKTLPSVQKTGGKRYVPLPNCMAGQGG